MTAARIRSLPGATSNPRLRTSQPSSRTKIRILSCFKKLTAAPAELVTLTRSRCFERRCRQISGTTFRPFTGNRSSCRTPKSWDQPAPSSCSFRGTASGRRDVIELPRTPGNPIERDFNLKRAILEVEVPLANGQRLVILNTHLEAFPRRTDVMQRQIERLLWRLKALDEQNLPWILGGDFNLLPPGQSALLTDETRGIHREPTEIRSIYERYQGVPTVAAATGKHMRHYFTFTQRSGPIRLPVRTLDYFFAAPGVIIEQYAVRQEGMTEISDHLPLEARFRIKGST